MIEAIVSLVIFGICVAGLCGLIGMSRELSDRARDHYVAINLAKNRLERAKTIEYDQLNLFQEIGVVVDVNGNASANGRFRRSTTVSQAMPNLKEVVVQVAIRDRYTLAFDGEEEATRTYVANFAEVD